MKVALAFLFSICSITAIAQPVKNGSGRIDSIDVPKFEIFTNVEQMPQAPYDVAAFISKNLRYPKLAADSSIEGRVVMKFLVDAQGYLDSINVMRSPHPLLSKEAMRIMRMLPQPWLPGKVNDVPVKCWFYLPVNFKLE